MDDRAAGGLGQLAGCDQGRDRGQGDGLAALVDDEAAVGVAVEGETKVGALGPDAGLEVDDVRRVEGLASWFGKVPSSSKYIGTTSSGRPSKTVGTVWPPMPLPASTTTLRGGSR